jgi:hypothetical protein
MGGQYGQVVTTEEWVVAISRRVTALEQIQPQIAVPIASPIPTWLDPTVDDPPDGFLFTPGPDVSRDIYEDLFDTIGTRFGAGDGVTTFGLPSPGTVPVTGMHWMIRY